MERKHLLILDPGISINQIDTEIQENSYYPTQIISHLSAEAAGMAY